MNITLQRKELKEAVQGFNKIISGKTTLPVLGCLRFENNGHGVVAQATDLDQTACYTFAEAQADGEGAFVVPLVAIKELAKGSAGDAVEFETTDGLNVVVTNHVGSHAVRHPVAGMELDEWPAMQTAVSTEPAAGFLEAYRKLLAFSSTDTTRYTLNGVYIDTTGKGDKPVSMVATDGRRLACFNSMALPIEKPLIVPASKFLATVKLQGEPAIGVRDDDPSVWFGLCSGPWCFSIKSVDGTYPNYKQVIPAETGDHVIVFTDNAVDVIKRVLPGFPGEDTITLVGKDGRVTVYGRSSCDDQWTTLTLESTTYRGDRTYVGVDRNYLLDALEAGFREFCITDELCPLVSRDGAGGLHVLMPMRVEDPQDAVDTATSDTGDVLDTVDKPVVPEAVSEPSVTPETQVKKPTTRRKQVTKQNENTTDPSALDRVLTACEAAKTKVKEAGQALTELASAIKDTAREQKVQAKEIESARTALTKLQSISL